MIVNVLNYATTPLESPIPRLKNGCYLLEGRKGLLLLGTGVFLLTGFFAMLFSLCEGIEKKQNGIELILLVEVRKCAEYGFMDGVVCVYSLNISVY
ncbi:MAG: hypothetical protein ACI8RA_001738 [Chlamydiales bacterium]|jgi:hypothetical protein